MQNQILVFGSIVQDLVSYVDNFPSPGESVRGKFFKTFCGGKGANQAVMAAKLGSNVVMVGKVGTDVFADYNIKSLNSFNVNTQNIRKTGTASTGTATINVSSDGENCIIVCLGANDELSVEDARRVEKEISNSKIVMCQSEADQQGNLEVFKIAKKYGVLTFFNPAPGRRDLDNRIVQLSDIICTNENEAEFVTGLKLSEHKDFENAARKMLENGPKIAIITLGPKGVIVAQKLKSGKINLDCVKTQEVKAVDTTGAGDCFCGSLAHFLAEDSANSLDETGIVEMVVKASKIATISVQREGSQISYPFHKELLANGII